VVEVDIGPAQGRELAASGAGHQSQMQVGEEAHVLGSDDVEETADLLDRRGTLPRWRTDPSIIHPPLMPDPTARASVMGK
jgi:hypothetical protein